MIWTNSVTQACRLPPRPSNSRILAKCLFPLRWQWMSPSLVQFTLQMVHCHLEMLTAKCLFPLRWQAKSPSLVQFTLQMVHCHFEMLTSKCLFPLRWQAMSPSLVQLTLQIVHRHLEFLISTNRLFIGFSCLPCFFASCILFSGEVLLLIVHFSGLFSGKLVFFSTEAEEALLRDARFLEFSSARACSCCFPWRCEFMSVWLLSVTWHIRQVQTFWAFWGDNMPVWSLTPILAVAVVTFDFFPSEAEETSPFGVWFLTFNCSRAALCRFPCRCELRTVSLWAVTWHRAQVHTFWTFSGGSIS